MSQLVDASAPPKIVPVVLPHSGDTSSGRIRNLPVSPQAVPRMLERRPGGEYRLKGAYTEKGYMLLRDLFEQERNVEGWAKYQRYVEAYQAGRTRSPFPVQELPAEVRRRQREPLDDDEFAAAAADEFTAKPTTGALHPMPDDATSGGTAAKSAAGRVVAARSPSSKSTTAEA